MSTTHRPNVLLIVSDDHAAPAISCYGSEMHLAHFNIPAHYGMRTERYKLIYYYGEALGSGGAIDHSTPPEWELFDLEKDPHEMHNVYKDPAYANVVVELKAELERLRDALEDYK